VRWKHRAAKQKQVETAITILQSPKSDDLPALKAWALTTVNEALGLPAGARLELQTSPLPSASNQPSIELHPPDPAFIADLRNKLHGEEKKWMTVALSEIGIPSSDRIHEYNVSTGLENLASSIPWNSQFVNWVMMNAGYTGTHSGLARSWLNWGVQSEEKLGAIVVLARPDNNPARGTVGFFVGTDKDNNLIILGGSIYQQVTTTTLPRSLLLGFRWPSRS
jgi:uncharacterized protein (TIGR02594 family)